MNLKIFVNQRRFSIIVVFFRTVSPHNVFNNLSRVKFPICFAVSDWPIVNFSRVCGRIVLNFTLKRENQLKINKNKFNLISSFFYLSLIV